ncbi:MAG: FkbM family methyltransferase [Candidatus Nezhaarchaeales archaeon]
MYGFVNVEGAVIVDVGAYIGETAMLFLSKGARRVYALEPVGSHYRYLRENVLKNNVAGRVIPLNYGAWFREATFSTGYEGPSTGLRTASETPVTIKAKHLGDILRGGIRQGGENRPR